MTALLLAAAVLVSAFVLTFVLKCIAHEETRP